MKVIIWIEKDQITNLLKGESVEYWEREPGMFEKTIQVVIQYSHMLLCECVVEDGESTQ